MTEKPETFFDQGQTSQSMQGEVVFTDTEPEIVSIETADPEVKTETIEKTENVESKTVEPRTGLLGNFDAPEKTTEVKEEPKREVSPPIPADIQARLDRLEQLEKNDAIKFLAGDKDLSELDFEAILKSAIPKDFSGTSNEDLLRSKLKGEYPTASPEEIEAGLLDKLEKFEALTEAEQKLERRSMIANLEKSQPENTLLKTVKELKDRQASVLDPQAEIQKRVDETFKDIHGYFKEVSSTLNGQSYKGYIPTGEELSKIPISLEMDVTSYDRERSFMNYFKSCTYDAFGDAREKIGYEKAMKEKSNPSQNNSDQTLMTKDDSTFTDAKKEDFFEQANN